MLKIRSARTDDSDFLGWVIFTSARGHLKHGWFDVVLQWDEEFCIDYCGKAASAAVRSLWHYSLFSVAEVDGQRAAALCGCGDESLYGAICGCDSGSLAKDVPERRRPCQATSAPHLHTTLSHKVGR